AVPAVALHRLALPGDQRAADAVLGAALAANEAMRVRVHAQRFATAHGRTVGIGDARVGFAAGTLTGQGQVDCAVGVERPRVPTVEFAQVGRHQRRVGKAGGRVVLGELRDRAGLGDGRLQALATQVGGAGAALALAEVDSDADAAIAGRFDCLDAAHAHADVEAALLRARHLGLVGTAGAAALEQARGDRLEAVQAALAVVG